jgi:sec-independent protein translocase protein TatA
MGWEAPWHWVILAVVVIALFGYKKLPDAARSLGRSLRIFKTEIKGMSQDDAARDASKTVPPVTAPAPPAAIEPPPGPVTGSADDAEVAGRAEKPTTSAQ